MAFKLLISVVLLSALTSCCHAAFVGSSNGGTAFRREPAVPSPEARTTSTRLSTRQYMLPSLTDSLLSSSNMWISTIDSDIANIPTNEFAPVFMGGIVVMFGGVLSALIVGFILENGNLYANVVADSYAQSSQDEDFWKGLSDEEKKKAQAMIDKLNAKKALEEGTASPKVSTNVLLSEVVVNETPDGEEVVQELDMFSDYADTAKKEL